MITLDHSLDVEVGEDLEAREPPEVRGLARDQVRLMVSSVSDDEITHTRFFDFPDFVETGDVVVVNTSATINAALDAERIDAPGDDRNCVLHLSTPVSVSEWVVELRQHAAKGTIPLLNAHAGERLVLPANATAELKAPYLPEATGFPGGPVRLWIAKLSLPDDAITYTARYGMPIRYGYVPKSWPLSYYQTIFARESGSAEMPSAGRAFTQEIVERLTRKGVRVAALTLHTGVSSLEAHEPPYPERYRVPGSTASAVNEARALGRHVVAVGTTVVRALETAANSDDRVAARDGWTDLVITPERGLRVVSSILTGFHEPKASHLAMLESLAGPEHLQMAYEEAIREKYLWHEFGDLHLIMGERDYENYKLGLPNL
ncbi:MAG TPA: S-adenosylmethionine:tRNA ribosyltransferase-isomerase [Gemmatimonadaceae bacterium]|nr:S-adenosylmethionine:tRNA ribosyltransferase-isomerase [Gemmatimonadaceae bacterium]